MAGDESAKDALRGRTLIVGLGKTGLSCARYLAARGVPVAIADSRDRPPELAALRAILPDALVLRGLFSAANFTACERLVVSPGVSLHEPAVAKAIAQGIPVEGDIDLFARSATAPVVAVTGTNGKSTVTALAGEMARLAGRKVAVGGNFGVPALDLLEQGGADQYVLELSSFQLETTSSLDAAAAVVLNLSPDHLDRYRNMDEYRSAKRRVYRGTGTAIINNDDPILKMLVPPGRRCIGFCMAPPAAGDYGIREGAGGDPCLARGNELLMPVKALRMRETHNVANVLAALALGEAVELPREAMLETARNFTGLPHRMEWVAECNGVPWYNDSKGTNVGATLAALRGLKGKVVLIAGGVGKGADFTPLGPVLSGKGRALVLMGEDAPRIAEAVGEAVPVIHAGDMEEAVVHASRLAQAGDTVLLSPACASFDMYRDYQERGAAFVAAVRRKLI